MSDYPELDRLAQRQQHLVTKAQCAEKGIKGRHVYYAARIGMLHLIRPGIYRWCGAKPSWKMMAMAAVLAAGDGAVLSHRSAAMLWGLLPEHDERVAPLHLTAGRQVRLVGVQSHRHALTDTEKTAWAGIPVTTIERTLLDLAESCDSTHLGRLIDDALRRRLTTTTKVAAAVETHAGPGRRPTKAIRAALADRGGCYDPGANDWEQRCDRMWDERGLPASARQYRVRTRRRTYVLDRAIVELKIGIEWNGRRWHGTRSAFDYDSDRRADLVEAGWLILDFTSNSSPARIARTVRKACADREKLLLLSA
jgi:very-short-patch-repair endonuclease